MAFSLPSGADGAERSADPGPLSPASRRAASGVRPQTGPAVSKCAFFLCHPPGCRNLVCFYSSLHGASVLKLEPVHHYLIHPPFPCSQGLVPSGGPEIVRGNWIEIMWYVGGGGEGRREMSLFYRRVISIILFTFRWPEY